MLNKTFILLLIASFWALGCQPERDDDIQLPPAPDTPDFSVELVAGDSNRVVIRDLSQNSFQRLWDLPGGTPKTSTKAVDTVFYGRAGEYTVSLFVSHSEGGGTSSASKKVVILTDAAPDCSPKLALLTGDCNTPGKCWTFSRAAGAVKVGPTYDDFSWFTSSENGLQDAQYDDGFCFTFGGFVFKNNNNGASVNPWNGYAAEAYDPGVSDFTFLEGAGISGRDQIVLPDDQFMGVWDADNVLDVIKLTATELVVRARIRAQNGTPNPEGWFELTFVPQ